MLRLSIGALALVLSTFAVSGAVAQTHAPVKPTPSVAAGHVAAAATPQAASVHDAPPSSDDRTSSCQALVPLTNGRPVAPETAGPGYATFIDPTVRVESAARVLIGCRSYVGPFASIDASLGPIAIGHESNIQDNAAVSGKLVVIGDRVIVAHGATIIGPATIGVSQGKPAFVGFNAYVDGAMIEGDAMVGVLARVGPGVILRSGKKVLPGKYVRTQAEADDSSLGKVASVTDADRAFMKGVLHVNTSLASGYTELFHSSPGQLTGIGRDPGHSDFNESADLPAFGGKSETYPEFRNRIIGHVEMASPFEQLASALGKKIAIRADEGEHFTFGIIGRVQDRVTFHALEHSDIAVGNNAAFGYHVVVHGGADDRNAPPSLTKLEDDVVVRDWAVVFRSTIGKGSTIGVRALVDGSQLAPGTVVPDRTIIIGNKVVGVVEW